MNHFVSTRGPAQATLAEALFQGLAPDGGLYVPTEIPILPAPPPEAGVSFVEAARWAAPHLLPEIAPEVIDRIVRDALSFPVGLVEIEPGLHIMELFHGPTHAFKDVGARFMARAMSALGAGRGPHTILVATSGDTGGAVADAFHGVEGYRVAVLFPARGISERQRRQMTTLGDNVLALAVEGGFDDCQRLVKQAFMDPPMRARHQLTSANSINVGRLIPQSLYYLYTAAALGWTEHPRRFSVPCGNLGNLFAGLLAHRAGMPAHGFVAGTNVNDTFVEFLATGAVKAGRVMIPTSSNAMDVAEPSNLERIRWLYENDLERIRTDISAVSVTDADTRDTIAEVYERTGYILDPHTAVGYRAARRIPSDAPTVVLATAHPAKFPDVVQAAIGIDPPVPEGLLRTMDLDERMIPISPRLDALAAALDSWELR